MDEQHIHNEEPVQGQNVAGTQNITQFFITVGKAMPPRKKQEQAPNISYPHSIFFYSLNKISQRFKQLHRYYIISYPYNYLIYIFSILSIAILILCIIIPKYSKTTIVPPPPSLLPSSTPVWMTKQVGGDIRSSPVFDKNNEFVYITSEDHKLYAYYAIGCGLGEQCLPLWASEPMEGTTDSSPAISHEKVYVSSRDGRLYVYNARGCGKTSCPALWVSEPTGDSKAMYSSPVVSDGTVYVSADHLRLYAYNADGCGKTECPPLWRSDLMGDLTISSPAVAKGMVYIGSYNNRLYVYDAEGCGKAECPPLWTGSVEGFISFSSPVIVDNIVYITSTDPPGNKGKLYAFNASGCGSYELSCTPLWVSAPTGARVDGSPVVANGVVYIGSEDKKLYAYDINTCHTKHAIPCLPLWVSDATGEKITSSPTVANGIVYVSSNDNKLYAYDAKGCGNQKSSCSPLWSSQALGTTGINSSPRVANGMVYISSEGGILYAFQALCQGTHGGVWVACPTT